MTPEAFAANAAALEGAPFRLGGRDPATGVDCVGLVACALGPKVAAPRGYALRNSSIARHLRFAAEAGFEEATGAMAIGDLVLVSPGPAQHHLLIALGSDLFVHAHAGLRRVAIHRGSLSWPELARWRLTQTRD